MTWQRAGTLLVWPPATTPHITQIIQDRTRK